MRNYRAFTTLELLIAIAVLAILVGIAVLGARSIIGGSKIKDTKVRLESLAGMLTEFEAVTGEGLKKQPAKMYYSPTPTPYPTGPGDEPLDIWYDADPQTADLPIGNRVGQPLDNPGDVSADNVKNANSGRFRSTAVHNTQIVMGLITGIPAAQEMLGKLPPASLMGNPNRDGTLNMGSLTFIGGDNKAALKPALVVDSWDNPIIFVPASGLRGVKLADHGPTELHIITSKGVVEEADPKIPAGVRPFFASPGPDGDFTTGDDNVYSFEN
jgi:type II secretory pathway pseudopilin PulG